MERSKQLTPFRRVAIVLALLLPALLVVPVSGQFFPKPPRDPRPERATIAFEAGRYEEVVKLLTPYLHNHPDNAEGWLYLGWSHYRLGEFIIAAENFRNSLKIAPESVDAIVGLGYATLQLEGAESAARHFRGALELDASRGDALRGLILASRRPDASGSLIREGALASRQLEILEGGDVETLMSSATLKPGVEKRFRPPVAGEDIVLNWRSGVDYLEQHDQGQWVPFYVKGVNLGVALPGRLGYEFPNDEGVYREWLKMISGIGFNTVRIYTLLPPAFYRALREHNDAGGSRLWLIQGIWADAPPDGDFSSGSYVTELRREISRTADAVHGNLAIGPRPGKAWGSYHRDVSDSLLAYIVGRSWEPFLVSDFNTANPEMTSWSGTWFEVLNGNPMECWTATILDAVVAHEADVYGVIHPVSFANWPTLDPLDHPTEATRAEENAWRERLGLFVPPVTADPEWNDDEASIDAIRITATPRNQSGLFASYEVYPAFPDFIDREYAGKREGDIRSAFARYLADLKRHHGEQPVMVIETGISTSRGVAHVSADGRSHGGHDEIAQGKMLATMMGEAHEEGMAGSIVFELFDEWFRTSWNTAPFELPGERKALWLNVQSPQQSYGLLAARSSAKKIVVDGDTADWSEIQSYATD